MHRKMQSKCLAILRVQAGLRTHETEKFLTPTPSHALVGPACTVTYVRVLSFTVAGAVPGLQFEPNKQQGLFDCTPVSRFTFSAIHKMASKEPAARILQHISA